MFIIAQIPFVDFRLLGENSKYTDCIFPNTFNKAISKPVYYRFLGEEKSRYSPNHLPESERQFFNAHKTLHLDSQAFAGSGIYYPRLLFSRLFEDAHSFHFDIGIRETFKNGFDRRDLNRFIKDFLVSPFFCINRKYDNTEKQYNFIQLTEQIKRIYLYATKSKQVEEHGNYSTQIVLGYPALFITYDKDEIHSFGDAKEIKINADIKVRYNLISINHSFVNVWFIGKKDISKYNQDLRNLRIYLSKLHAYKESTRVIIDYLKRNNMYNLDIHRVSIFFEYVLSLMNKKKYYGYNNTDFWEIVFNVDKAYNDVSWNGYQSYMDAIIKEAGRMGLQGNFISIGDNSTVGDINQGGNKTIINANEHKMEEAKKEFDDTLKKILEEYELTSEEIEKLRREFEQCIKKGPAEKERAAGSLSNIKNVLNRIVGNSNNIQKLIEIVDSMLNILK